MCIRDRLSLVLVFSASIHKQVGKQLTTQTALGQHTPHCLFDNALRVLGQQFAGRLEALSARIARVPDIDLVGHFLTGQFDFFGVDNDHVITTINVRCEIRLVFAPDDFGYFTGQTA